MKNNISVIELYDSNNLFQYLLDYIYINDKTIALQPLFESIFNLL